MCSQVTFSVRLLDLVIFSLFTSDRTFFIIFQEKYIGNHVQVIKSRYYLKV